VKELSATYSGRSESPMYFCFLFAAAWNACKQFNVKGRGFKISESLF